MKNRFMVAGLVAVTLTIAACGGGSGSGTTSEASTTGTSSTSGSNSSGSSSTAGNASSGSTVTTITTHELAKLWTGLNALGTPDGGELSFLLYSDNSADIMYELIGTASDCQEKWSATYDDAAKKLTVRTLYPYYVPLACGSASPFTAGGVYNWSIVTGTWKVLTVTNVGGTTVFTGRTSPL